jgi:hypothetical protein
MNPASNAHWEALAGSFELLTAQGALNIEDPVIAANHFVGLLLWIPINRVMFSGANSYSDSETAAFANAAVDAFLRAYGVAALPSASRSAASSHGPRLRRARSAV